VNEEKIIGRFFTGVNYWASANATNMWTDFNAESIERDLTAMKSAGITHLRVFPSWHVFQPLNALYTTSPVPYEYTFGEEPLPDTEAGRAGVSEEACRRFEVFCDLLEKYNLKMIVGLITGHMSFREYLPPAFIGKNRLSDPTVIKWQIRFVKYFVKRFRGRACIVGWDLGNEVNNTAKAEGSVHDDFYVWCSAIADAIRACDSERPIVSGMDAFSIEYEPDNLVVIRETCDIHTCHPYNIFYTHEDPLPSMKPILDIVFKCRLSEDIAGVPTFVQEFGSIGYLNCSKATEAAFYRAALYASLAHGCHGVMWWCAFDQGHLRIPPYNWNNIGSDYGFFDKDLQPKPIVEENLRFAGLLERLPEGKLPPHETAGVILVPRDNGSVSIDMLRAAFLLGKQANLDLSFSYVMDPIPDAPLYILPSLASNQCITARRLDEVLAKVEQGAALYCSLGDCLFRQIPEIMGVQTAWRECVPFDTEICFSGDRLPVHVPVRYTIESADADVLARDTENTPVFFVKKHGRGKLFFMLYPLEADLAARPGVFSSGDVPRYDSVYRTLAKEAGIARRVDTDSPFIRATEHRIDDRRSYIVLINYSQYPQAAKLTVADGRLVPFYGAETENGVLNLRGNDAAIFIHEKE